MRNLLSPILAGGATILAPGFDAALFWDVGPRLGVTWCDNYCSATNNSSRSPYAVIPASFGWHSFVKGYDMQIFRGKVFCNSAWAPSCRCMSQLVVAGSGY